jgi:hypothetical protein
VSASRSPAAKSMRELAEQLLPPVSSAEAKAAGKNAGAEAKAQKRNAPKLPSPGRQSVLKAGMSRFSKSKDKKAA